MLTLRSLYYSLAVLSLTVLSVQVSASTVIASSSSHRLMATDCWGARLEIDFSTGSVALLTFDEGGSARGRDGCVFDQVIQSGEFGTLAVLDEGPTENGRKYSLARVDFDTATITARFDLPGSREQSPTLVVDNVRKRILLFQESEKLEIEADSDGAFHLVSAWTPFGSVTSGHPHVSESGLIIDDLRVLNPDLSGPSSVVRKLAPDGFFDASLRQFFMDLTRIPGTDRRYFGGPLTASAAGRAVFVIGPQSEGHDENGIAVVDVETSRVLSRYKLPFAVSAGQFGAGLPVVHIAPNGSRVVVEEFRWTADSAKMMNTNRTTTGRIAILDVATGMMEVEVTAPAPSGEVSRVVGLSSDGSEIYFLSKAHLCRMGIAPVGTPQCVSVPADFKPVFYLRR